MQTHIYPTQAELNTALAAWVADLINNTLKIKDRFTFCLSGGSTPKGLYEVLAADYAASINWKLVHFFWGDERYVSFEDDDNNARMAFQSLLSKVPVDEKHVHNIRTDIAVWDSVRQYESILHKYFDHDEVSFDLTLLGMGEDGHTLSLFPGNTVTFGQGEWVSAVVKEDSTRITLTPSIINHSSTVAFLIAGENKSQTLQQVMEGPHMPATYPSQLINPLNGKLHYFLDEGAAKSISHHPA